MAVGSVSACARAVLLCAVLLVPPVFGTEGSEAGLGKDPLLTPLDTLYALALEHYGARNWDESARLLELSLRAYRTLRENEARCTSTCARGDTEPTDTSADTSLRLIKHILTRAACIKQCKAEAPVLALKYPKPETLHAFSSRTPYRYLQYSYYQMNNVEKAVSAAHTFLQRNPDDPLISKNMNFYKSLFDVEEYLIDQEEKPHETLFLQAVMVYNEGDYSNSVRMMEEVCVHYYSVYDECVSACEGSHQIEETKDFYQTLSGYFMEVLRCRLRCEQDLTPNVGGFFVKKFVATVYHYMQFAYYKLNYVTKAVPCALSYLLFDPDDKVMKQNVEYYRLHREQWGLKEEQFIPCPEALRYYNQTVKQSEMMEFAQNYLLTDDEDIVSPEQYSSSSSPSPDEEFDGVGDYEESFLAEWWQDPKTKWDVGE
ncbi:endoplasmic reticulum protein SC65 [Trichomycterus rosablanca]|uniref:endoplasmic reticulum protein SC65 n=1 Tax=Trichomycterus rosablanca TaxID=2290929 RepID=UPI002F353016